jgi:hypothetical protein
VATDAQWAFKKDDSFDYTNPVSPALPAESNSINMGYSWAKDGKFKFDPNHANDAGCYLAGLVWYGFLFKADPTKLSFKPKTVEGDFAAFLKGTAKQTLAANK